jgi:beta-lactamase class A
MLHTQRVFIGLLVVVATIVSDRAHAQDRPAPTAGSSVEATIAGGGSHVYRLTSTGKEFLHLVVDQKGVDVVVTMSGPGVDVRVDSPNEDAGPEPVEVVLESAGNYVVTVTPLEPDAKEGRYALRVVERRPVVPSDTPRLASRPGTPLGELRLAIERTTRSINATWGIFVKCLETGEEIAINADATMDTMSVIKIPLMIEVFEQAKAGRLRLDDRHTLAAADRRGGSGTLRMMDPGAVMTVKDLVTYMIVVSDNTATDVLYRLVGGPAAVTARMRSYGLTATTVEHPASTYFEHYAEAGKQGVDLDEYHRRRAPFATSTPREIGVLLERMTRGELVDRESSALMLSIMRGQQMQTRIPRFLENPFLAPHKTGDNPPYIANDVGVINMPGRTIVISVFTANHFGDYGMLEEAIGRISERVAIHFTNRR